MDQPLFTPLFDDQPMVMDGFFDMPLGDWPEWAPSELEDGLVRAPREIAPKTRVPEGGLLRAPREVAPFESPNIYRFIDGDLTTAGPAHQIFDYGTLPPSTVDSNGAVLPTSSHCSTMEILSQVSGISAEGNPLLLSNPGEPNPDEDGRLYPFRDVEYLASLPPSILKELSKNVAEALATPKQARKESVASGGENSLQVHGKRAAQSTIRKSSTISDVLRCEHPGCKTTFRRNKDRLRHFRHKHESSTKTFTCPVVDCPSGFGHKFTRSDKVRDHLRAKKILSCLHWSCVIPGCSEIPGGRASLIDHIGQHDHDTRKSNKKVLVDYGLAFHGRHDYIWATYICSIPECPFGTDSKSDMDAHLSIHHNGPFCPCPIPSCQRVFQDYDSTFTHVVREHDRDTKVCFWKEINNQHMSSYSVIFLCPICQNEIKRARESKVRLHCQEHDHQELLRFSEALMKAWNFSFGPIIYSYGRFTITGDMIVPYVVLPMKEVHEFHTKADFEQGVARIKAAIELSKNAQLS